jgi:Domain of unknown function (DUF4157)
MSKTSQSKVKAAPRPPLTSLEPRLSLRPLASQLVASAEPPLVQEGLRSPSQPLDPDTLAFMGMRFGHDFSQVRVHTDARAADSARALNARAYTVGQDIVFAAGQYAPDTTAGQRLLGHELTHVVQQAGSPTLQRQVDEAARPTPPPGMEVPPAKETAEAPPPEEVEGAEAAPELAEPLPEAIYVSEDVAPLEGEEGTPEATIATAPASPPPSSLAHSIVPPDHPSEREAEAVSEAVLSGPEKGGPPRITSVFPAGMKRIQRQIFWDVRNTLNWADFKAKAPKGSPSDALTFSGFKMAAWKLQKDVNPWPPPFPEQCKVGSTTTTKFHAVYSLDISSANLNVRAFMQPSQSWVKPGKQSPGLLAHEQGHFDISNVIAEKTEFALFLWGIQHVGVGEACGKTAAQSAAAVQWNAHQPKKAISKIFKKGFDVLNKAQKDYDNDTGHGVKVAEQKAWQGNITADLPGYDVL